MTADETSTLPDELEWPCPKCGYDLRASIDKHENTARCPECGSTFQLIPGHRWQRNQRRVFVTFILGVATVPVVAIFSLGIHAVADHFGGNIVVDSLLMLLTWVGCIAALCSFFVCGLYFNEKKSLIERLCWGFVILACGIALNYQSMIMALEVYRSAGIIRIIA